jgi:hypothetical protein
VRLVREICQKGWEIAKGEFPHALQKVQGEDKEMKRLYLLLY